MIVDDFGTVTVSPLLPMMGSLVLDFIVYGRAQEGPTYCYVF